MSEIKGQILGVVLVLAIFGAIGTVLVNAFTTSATEIGKKISTDTEPTPTVSKTTTSANANNIDLSNLELLTF